MTAISIRTTIACLLLACAPAIAIPQSKLSKIKTCIAIGGTRGQASPPKSITVVGASKGYYLLRIGDRAGNPPYERIIKLNPCRTVFIDQGGDTPLQVNMPGLPASLTKELIAQKQRFDQTRKSRGQNI